MLCEGIPILQDIAFAFEDEGGLYRDAFVMVLPCN